MYVSIITADHLKKLEKNDSKDLVDYILKSKESNSIIIESNCLTDFSKKAILNLLEIIKKHNPNIKEMNFILDYKENLEDDTSKINQDIFDDVGKKLAEFKKLNILHLNFNKQISLTKLICPLLNKSLLSLNLGTIVLKNIDESKALLEVISKSKKLEGLAIDYKSLGLDRGEILNYLSDCTSLRRLKFSSSSGNPSVRIQLIDDKGLTSSTKCPKLKELSLFSRVPLDSASIERLKELLNNELAQLNSFRISSEMIEDEHKEKIKELLTKPNSKAITFSCGMNITWTEGDCRLPQITNIEELSEKEKLNNLINEWYDIENLNGAVESSKVPSLKSLTLKHMVKNSTDQQLEKIICKLPKELQAPLILKQKKLDVTKAFLIGKGGIGDPDTLIKKPK